MAYSKTFLLVCLLFAVVLIMSSKVSARELAETAQTQGSVEDGYGYGKGHGGYGKGHGGYGKGHGGGSGHGKGHGGGGHGKGKGHGHGKPGHGADDVEGDIDEDQN